MRRTRIPLTPLTRGERAGSGGILHAQEFVNPGSAIGIVIHRIIRKGGGCGGALCVGVAIACPYGVHGERLHGVLRERLNGLTRQTHAFAKRVCLWAVVGVLRVFERTWWCLRGCWRARVDGLLEGRRYRRRRSALAIGWTDDIWS